MDNFKIFANNPTPTNASPISDTVIFDSKKRAMQMPLPNDLNWPLAWSFSEVLPGAIRRASRKVADVEFPILGPMPEDWSKLRPVEGNNLRGPFLYCLFDAADTLCYIGKATEKNLKSPLHRWKRRDATTGRTHWTHGTRSRSGGVLVGMADGIKIGDGPYRLFYSNYDEIKPRLLARAHAKGLPEANFAAMSPAAFIAALEGALILTLGRPRWNMKDEPTTPDMVKCCEFWRTT